MPEELKKYFADAKKPKGKDDLAVYLVIFKQTPAPQPATAALLAEQTVYARKLEALQKKSGRNFPHLVLPGKGVLSPALLVCTQEIAEKLRSLPGVNIVTPHPEIPLSSFRTRVEKTIGADPL